MESKGRRICLNVLTAKFFLVCIIYFFIPTSEGIRCWTCDNAISNADCLDRGRSLDCYSAGMGCSSEVRYHAGFVNKIQIRKGCKQALACGSDKSQNGHGWYPVQCNPKFPDSICRCCCQTNNCNRNLIGCEPPQPDCKRLVAPKNGFKICNNEDYPTALRSICTFSCNRGYELEGDGRAKCVKTRSGKAVWTLEEPPRCITKTCTPQYKSSPIRRVYCTDKNNAGSVCTFNCASGYIMNGEPKSTCLFSKNWDYPTPDCVKITCPPAIFPPEHGSMSCTDGEELGSICRYTCEADFTVDGDGIRECVLSTTPDSQFGSWSGALPQCVAITCEPKHINPPSGGVECTDMNYIGSTCFYHCKDNYVLEGPESNSCLWNTTSARGSWNTGPPVCTPTRCPDLQELITNGIPSCTNENKVGSMCAIACNAGSYLRLPSDPDMLIYHWIVSCLYGGKWSQELPTCAKITCNPDISEMGVKDGSVMCSNGNNFQSECGFSCNEGFDLIGEQKIACRAGGPSGERASWNNAPPKCIESGCPSISESSKVLRMSCSKWFEEGSVCSFSCNSGYFMSLEDSVPYQDDDYSIECMAGQAWSGLVPVCIEIRCFPPFGAITNGRTRCTNANRRKSKCTFSCDVAYGVQGSPNSHCTDNQDSYGEGIWTKTQPTCVRNGCAPIFQDPVHGKVTCKRRNLFRSICTFTCDPGSYMKSFDHYLVETNSVQIRCSTDGDWSEIPPTCHPIVCEPLKRSVANGNISCTNGNNWHSECKYVCDTSYEVNKESDTAICTDQMTSSAFGQWSQQDTKCKRATCTMRQRAPNGGKVACSFGNGVGSECIFICYEGYYMNTTDGKVLRQNKFEIECEWNKKWTASAPRCLPVTCPRTSVPNGDVSCTNENQYFSLCKFYCLPGYQLVGSNTSRCIGGKNSHIEGYWNEPWPKCEELKCDSRATRDPKNGFVLCSDGARLRSTCEFMCDIGYSLVGEQYIVCEATMKWTTEQPRCVKDKKSGQ